MASLRSVVVDAPSSGLYTLGDNPARTAPVFKNFLPDTPGWLPLRGPVKFWMELVESPNQEYISGAVLAPTIGRNGIFIGTFDPEQGSVPPWRANFVKPQEADEICTPKVLGELEVSSSIYYSAGWFVNLDEGVKDHAGVISGGGLENTFGNAPFMNVETLGGTKYYLAVAANWDKLIGITYADQAENGGYVANTVIGVADNTTNRWQNGLDLLFKAQYVKTHLNKLWVFGGIPPNWKPSTTATDNVGVMGSTRPYALFDSKDKELFDTIRIGDEITAPSGLKGAIVKSVERVVGEGVGGIKVEQIVFETNIKVSGTGPYTGVVIKHKSLGESKRNTLFYSTSDHAISTEAFETTSPISGLKTVNQIVVGSESEDDYLVGGAVVNKNLMIFKRHSIWYLTGYSPETFQLQQLSGERGCIDPWSICEANNGCYFLSQDGFEFFDGSEFHNIDEPVANSVRIDALYLERPDNKDVVRTQINAIGNDYLMINMSSVSFPNLELDERSGWYLYHMTSGSWTEVTSLAVNSQVPSLAFYKTSTPFVYDNRNFLKVDNIVLPDLVDIGERYDSTKTKNRMIPAEFETDRIDISGSGGYTSQLHRFMMDYRAETSVTTKGKKQWYVWILNDSDLPINDPALAYELDSHEERVMGSRFEVDNFSEAVSGIRLKVEPAQTEVEEGLKSELSKFEFEVQTARQRRKI